MDCGNICHAAKQVYRRKACKGQIKVVKLEEITLPES
jgi:hypothetical protein